MTTPKDVSVALLLVYGAAAVAGVAAVSRRGSAPWTRREPAEWIAARQLAPFEQLDSADLAAPGDTARKKLPDQARLVGRHLVKFRPKGAPVSVLDVGPLSVGQPRAGTIRFVLAARSDQAPALALAHPGQVLSPCIAAAGAPGALAAWECRGAFTVVALHRTLASADSFWAVLEAADAGLAARFVGAASRMLVAPPVPPPSPNPPLRKPPP